MIFVKRISEPSSLTKNKSKWLSEYLKIIEICKLDPSLKNKKQLEKTENKYKKVDIKASLKFMFNGKCAYCESYLTHISYGHIEHFKPKSKYPSDCFNWENLLLSCEVCNGPKFKSIHFPLSSGKAILINPCIENPSNFFDFEYDPNTGLANVLGLGDRGAITEKILGLNRPELVKYRSRVVRRIAFIAIKASMGESDAIAEMQKLVDDEEEYSAFAKKMAKKFNISF